MGANASKPGSEPPTHVWKGSAAAAAVSQDMIESLQTSLETDSSRAQLHEAQIQARVAAELRKLHDEETRRLTALLARLTDDDDDNNNNNNTSASEAKPPPLDRRSTQAEIAALERKLQTRRRRVAPVPESVEAARAGVVQCLREKDRRPLDCWREVQAFKEEVRRLEKGWVERVVS